MKFTGLFVKFSFDNNSKAAWANRAERESGPQFKASALLLIS